MAAKPSEIKVFRYRNNILYVNQLYTSVFVRYVNKSVDNVENYESSRYSPNKYTSPAPIVINRSFGIQWVKIW